MSRQRAIRDAGGRFLGGVSGNPKGRPRKAKPPASPFHVLFEQTVQATRDGKVQELTTEDALTYRIYQKAMQGNRTAERELLRMMERRQAWFDKRSGPPTVPRPEVKIRTTPTKPYEAMLLLGIVERVAAPNPRPVPSDDDDSPPVEEDSFYEPDLATRFKLSTWAVEAAFAKARRLFTEKEIDDIKFGTAEHRAIRWPEGRRHDD